MSSTTISTMPNQSRFAGAGAGSAGAGGAYDNALEELRVKNRHAWRSAHAPFNQVDMLRVQNWILQNRVRTLNSRINNGAGAGASVPDARFPLENITDGIAAALVHSFRVQNPAEECAVCMQPLAVKRIVVCATTKHAVRFSFFL